MIKNFIKIIIFIVIINFIIASNSLAVSPTATVTPKLSITPSSPSTTLSPTTTDDEKIKDIRDSAKATVAQEKIEQIKEKIEKKAFVGIISEITDSTITLTNFRGKQRVRIIEGLTTIIGGNKKEIIFKDLVVEDKVIALGEPDNNDVLEAKRIIVVPKPKTPPPQRLTVLAKISEINAKTSMITITEIKNPATSIQIKIDKNTFFTIQNDPKKEAGLKDLKTGQKVIIVYPQPVESKTAIAKTIFILP